MKYLIGLPLLAVFLFFVPIGLNRAMDDDLNPAIAEYVAKPPVTVPDEAIRAFKYALAIRVPVGLDPAVVGEAIYEANRVVLEKNPNAELKIDTKMLRAMPSPNATKSFAPDPFMSRAKFEESKVELTEALAKTAPMRTRFDKLLELGAPGSPLPPRLELIAGEALLTVDLFRDKLVELTARLHGGEARAVAVELARMNRFAVDSLRYPLPLLDVMIRLSALGQNRRFAEGAAAADPKFKAALSPEILESFRLSLSLEEIARPTLWTEYVAIGSVWGAGDESLELTNIDQDAISTTPLNAFQKRLYQINRTRNAYYVYLQGLAAPECLSNIDACPKYEEHLDEIGGPLFNPRGRLLFQILAPMLDLRWERLQKSHAELSQPFKI